MVRKLFSILFAAVLILSSLAVVPTANAQQCTSETSGSCIRGYSCICEPRELPDGRMIDYCYRDSSQPCGAESGQRVIGPVRAPEAVAQFNIISSSHIGIVPFLSVLIRVITIIAGIFTMVNFVIAGAQYVFSMGDTNVNIAVRDRLLFSIIGLLIIVSAYTIAGLFGLIFFGDATFILEPTLTGAGDLAQP